MNYLKGVSFHSLPEHMSGLRILDEVTSSSNIAIFTRVLHVWKRFCDVHICLTCLYYY